VHGQPPGKQPEQIQQIAASATSAFDSDEEIDPELIATHAAAKGLPLEAPWRLQQPEVQQPAGVAVAAASAAQQAAPPAAAPPPAAAAVGKPGSSRKRPASQGADSGQRKKPANGAAAGAPRALPGAPGSLARAGDGPPQIKTIAGAPRSLQQRQQLVNGVLSGAGRPGAAGAPRPKQPALASAKAKQAKPSGGSGQRKAAGGGGGGSSAPPGQFKQGDVVWAKVCTRCSM
jgi:translation initiation factor IF-2